MLDLICCRRLKCSTTARTAAYHVGTRRRHLFLLLLLLLFVYSGISPMPVIPRFFNSVSRTSPASFTETRRVAEFSMSSDRSQVVCQFMNRTRVTLTFLSRRPVIDEILYHNIFQDLKVKFHVYVCCLEYRNRIVSYRSEDV